MLAQFESGPRASIDDVQGVQATQARLGYLDTLRGISAVVVVIHHLHLGFARNLPFDLGKFGIFMFFAISGYIIPKTLRPGPTWETVKAFVIKRFFRLYPTYWLSILIALALMYAERPSATTIIANFTMIQMFLGKPNIILVYWTLQFELIFYVLCVVLFVLGKLHKRNVAPICMTIFLLASIVVGAVRFIWQIPIPGALTLSMSTIMFGFVVEQTMTERKGFLPLFGYFCLFAIPLIVAVFLAYDINLEGALGIPWYKYAVSYVGAALIFLNFVCNPRLTSPLTEFLGRISYSTYLIHIVVITILFKRLNLATWLSNATTFGSALTYVGIFACVLAFATLMHFAVERPFADIGKWFALKACRQPMTHRH